MRRVIMLSLTLAALIVPPAQAASARPSRTGLEGVVQLAAGGGPVPRALVFAYDLASLAVHRSETGADGAFLFRTLPPGIYKLVAYRRGFAPAVAVLVHSAGAAVIAPLRLTLTSAEDARLAGEPDPWQVRAQLPADILRELEALAEDIPSSADELPGQTFQGAQAQAPVSGEMSAIAGVGSELEGTSLSQTRLDLQSSLGRGWKMGVAGEYTTMSRDASRGDLGSATAIAIDLAPGSRQTYRIETAASQWNHPDHLSRSGQPVAVDYRVHSIAWKRSGDGGAVSNIGAEYVEEMNFFRGQLPPLAVFPQSSRSLEVTGSYYQPLDDSQFLHVGMLYRQQATDATLRNPQDEPGDLGAFDAFARAGWSPWAPLVVDGGLQTQYDAGVLSLAPRAGIVCRLHRNVQLTANGEMRVRGESSSTLELDPVFYATESIPSRTTRYHYESGIVVSGENSDRISVSASRKELEKIVRLFFDDRLIQGLDSAYLFPGDVLDEVRLSVDKEWTRSVSASAGATYGTVRGATQTDEGLLVRRGALVNDAQLGVGTLRVFVKPTRTGVALLYRSVDQTLTYGTQAAPERLQLRKVNLEVAQDFSFLQALPADWKLLLSMELAERVSVRPPQRTTAVAQVDRRILGGLAVSF